MTVEVKTYYHVFLKLRDKNDDDWLLASDYNKESLEKRFVGPFNNNEDILFIGRTINKKLIHIVFIFSSLEKLDKLVTSDGLKLSDIEDNFEKFNLFLSKKIKYTINCSDLFLLTKKKEAIPPPKASELKKPVKIFIVHGKDNEMKEAVARTLEKLECEAIILHEQPNEGRTIVEKFSDNANESSFAVVLFSPDDMAYLNGDSYKKAKPRARQNVILELGFFMGKLERKHTIALCRKADGFEMPSDYAGVVYIEYDDKGHWKYALAKELKACGLTVDLNKI